VGNIAQHSGCQGATALPSPCKREKAENKKASRTLVSQHTTAVGVMS
jgi:hypothetical protein